MLIIPTCFPACVCLGLGKSVLHVIQSWALAVIFDFVYNEKCYFFHFLLSEFDLGQIILIGLACPEMVSFYRENGLEVTF